MRFRGRAGPVALGAILLSAASGCTSDPDAAAGDGDGGGGSTRGLTEDTLRLGVIGYDFGTLSRVGLAPDLGDQEGMAQAVVEQVNEDGGIGGRRIELRTTLVDPLAGPQAGHAGCLEMTEDFGAFAVVISSATSHEVARCTAATNRTLTLAPLGFHEALYEEAEGRLFTVASASSMSTDRQYRGWAEMMDAEGVLDGRTVGIVTDERSPELVAAAEEALIPALEDLGHEVAVSVTLPCPEGDNDCDQHEPAVQQMKDAGVEVVFMAASDTIGVPLVQAAENLGFRPRWLANGNQVTDTVSQYFESVHGAWDGTVGSSPVFARLEHVTDEAYACNDIVAERSGEEYDPGSDAFRLAAVICLMVQLLDRAGDGIEPAELNQASVIEAIEQMGEVPVYAGPPGSLSPDKHDAGDYLVYADFVAAEGRFVERDTEPVRVDG